MADKNPKVYTFSREELNFLQPRQVEINRVKLVYGDIDYVMQQYIVNEVLKRLSIDPNKNSVRFDIFQNSITVTENEKLQTAEKRDDKVGGDKEGRSPEVIAPEEPIREAEQPVEAPEPEPSNPDKGTNEATE